MSSSKKRYIYNFKYEITIDHPDNQGPSKSKYFRTTVEICEFLGISKNTYNNLMINRIQFDKEKTKWLQHVHIKKLDKDAKKKLNNEETNQNIYKDNLLKIYDSMLMT